MAKVKYKVKLKDILFPSFFVDLCNIHAARLKANTKLIIYLIIQYLLVNQLCKLEMTLINNN